MRPKGTLFVAAILGGALVWIVEACVGDDPQASGTTEAGAATGDRGGPCFADGKCKEGLVCDGVVCALIDGGGSSSSGSSSGASSSGSSGEDAPSDAGIDVRCTLTTDYDSSAPFACFTQGDCDANATCCASETKAQCIIGSGLYCRDAGMEGWACTGEAQCAAGGASCCAVVGSLGDSDCTGAASRQLFHDAALHPICYSDCSGATQPRVRLCQTNAGCTNSSGGTCQPTEVVLAGKRYVLGTCL